MAGARRWPWLALVLSLALIGFFSLRAWQQWQYLQRVQRGDVQVQTLRGWMTLAYIEKVYGVPEARLRAALGLPGSGHDERSLREWFDAAGLDPEAARRTVESLILQQKPLPAGSGTPP
jgi:hypothetical protein